MIHCIDDFCEDYQKELAYAETSKYLEIASYGVFMKEMSLTRDSWATDKLSSILGTKLKRIVSYFRRYRKERDEVTFIHSDQGVADISAVLSVSDQYNGRFRTWRHRQTGQTFPEDISTLEKLHSDGLDSSNWEIIDDYEMKPNRIIVYPAKLFHSRWPKIWMHEWPRTIKVFFFNEQ